MDIPHSPFNLGGTHNDAEHMQQDQDEDAALAALRAAIGAGRGTAGNDADAALTNGAGVDVNVDDNIDPALDEADLEVLKQFEADTAHQAGTVGADNGAEGSASAADQTAAVSLLAHLHRANTALMSRMNLPAVLEGLLANVKTLAENQQKQGEIINSLVASRGLHLGHGTTGMCSFANFRNLERDTNAIDPAGGAQTTDIGTGISLTSGWVPQSQYDALHAKYTALTRSTGSNGSIGPDGLKPAGGRKKGRKAAEGTPILGMDPSAGPPGGDEDEGDAKASGSAPAGRKKRSVRLEVGHAWLSLVWLPPSLG